MCIFNDPKCSCAPDICGTDDTCAFQTSRRLTESTVQKITLSTNYAGLAEPLCSADSSSGLRGGLTSECTWSSEHIRCHP